MTRVRIVDALYGIPKPNIAAVMQVGDCLPSTQDLAPPMRAAGISGAVLAPRACTACPHQWNCADRRTDEMVAAARRNPGLVTGLASYDALRIGESLRWIEESITTQGLAGAYAAAECCVSGLDARRMYPLYGLCAMLRKPVLLDFAGRDGWIHHRPDVEVVAADFPELEIVLAPPPRTDPNSIIRLLQRFHSISFVLCPQELQEENLLRAFVEQQARERLMFCSTPKGWESSVSAALTVPLDEPTRRAFLGENAIRIFGFKAAAEAIEA